MADSAIARTRVMPPASVASGHSALVRVTHWVTALCFLALLVSGVEILISHPRFYWGETGNVDTQPLFIIPIPASRATVPTGYGYVLPDQNGWSRSLHFQSAWFVGIAGIAYLLVGLSNGHFRRKFLPDAPDRSWKAFSAAVADHLHFRQAPPRPGNYNLLQRFTYLLVVFVLFPLTIWTGLAMSPGWTAAFPFLVEAVGGQQSARTIHFFLTIALSAFVAVHLVMIVLTGFRAHMGAMITGSNSAASTQERT